MRGPIAIAVSGAIGLTTEAVAAVKQSRARKSEKAEHEEHLAPEDDWMLDEAERQTSNKSDMLPNLKLLENIPKVQWGIKVLQHPVIVPQRRPRTRSRGFMRAYAPELEACQVDQALFLSFLEGFDDAIKKQALFIVANMAVGASVLASTAILGHNPIVDLVAFAVHSTIEAGRRMYITDKYSKYLIDMNERLFQPRGLYALIMCYKPNSDNATEIVDLETQVALSAAKGGDTGSKFKTASGTSHGEIQMPEAAPLIFPELRGATEGQNVFQKTAGFFGNYSDRRAQAVFAAQNPDSSLNTGQPPIEFSSRYADPNHAVNKAGPIGVLTGGVLGGHAKEQEQIEKENVAAGRPLDAGTGGMIGGLKRLIREDVMYLMVVNMPTEKEMARAAELAAQFHQQ